MFCPKCKTQNPDNAQSCWFCHSVLTPVSPSSPALSVKTSGLAIASLVLGILAPFTCFLTAIPAIVLGIIAIVKVSKSAGRLKGNGPAIAGICVPVVALPVIVLLMGIMMPALARVRQVSFRMVCATNMVRLGKAMPIYACKHNDMFPTSSKWCDLLIEHVEVTPKSFICNGAPEGPCNYAMNINVEGLALKDLLPDMVLLFETQPGWNQAGGPEILSTDNHQGEGCNIVFVDSHVQFVKTKDLKNLRWTASENETSPPEPIPLPP